MSTRCGEQPTAAPASGMSPVRSASVSFWEGIIGSNQAKGKKGKTMAYFFQLSTKKIYLKNDSNNHKSSYDKGNEICSPFYINIMWLYCV